MPASSADSSSRSRPRADKPRSLDPLIGSLLADKFRIERVIGRGGMGLVYLAQDVDRERTAVIKLLAPQWLDDRTAVQRFEREGKRLQQLAHPNIVQMYECGRHADSAYIAMEYLDGEPLRRFMRRRGQLSLAEFVPIAAQVLAAVGYAHTFNIMLRDIKPPNIMLCERDGKANFVKLLDFGLAKLVDGDHEEVTKSHVIGTAGYLAPEQIKGDPCDVRVDVYAIGVLFYMMLAGESPIAGDNDGALLYNHVHGTPKPLGTVLPAGHNVPEALIALVHQCLEKDPERRLNDANEVAEALFECVPPKLLALPDADDESRRALREYRDARDRGEDEDGARAQSSSEWTKPVLKPASGEAPADASTTEAATVMRARPTTTSQPVVAANPAKAASDRSGPPKPPSKPNPTGAVRRPTPEQLKPPVRRPTPTLPAMKSTGIPTPVSDRQGSRASAPRGSGPISTTLPPPAPRRPPRPRMATGSSDSIPAMPSLAKPIVVPVVPKTPVATPIADDAARVLETSPVGLHDTGPTPADGGLFDREERRPSLLPVPRRMLVAFGVGLVTLGALLAWVIFVPPDGGSATTVAASAAPTAAASPKSTSPSTAPPVPSPTSPAAPSPTGEAPAPDAQQGAVEFKAIAGARVEVDGVDMGPAPLTAPLPVGTHRVKITAPGYVPWEETIDIVEGDNPALEPRLKRKRGGAKTSGGLPTIGELGDAPEPVVDESAPLEETPKSAPSSSPFDDEPSSPPPAAEPKAPEPFKPPPPPDPPKRDDTFLPAKKPTESSDTGLLPTN